jgi:hypothetical protein
MSKNPDDASAPSSQPFDVFRSDGSTRLPGQRFPNGEAHESTQRSGPVEQRVISDASGGPSQGATERSNTLLRSEDQKVLQPPTDPPDASAPESVTIRLQTYQVNLAERIARVKAEQKEALGNLQKLEDDNRDED